MNQVMGILRAVVPAAVAWAVAKGWVPTGIADVVSQSTLDIIAALITVGSAYWSARSNSPTAVIKEAAAMAGTQVEPAAGGKAVIRVVNPDLARAAKEAATPVSG